jgi:uncharacterized repeat protein (TIGR01451 family)
MKEKTIVTTLLFALLLLPAMAMAAGNVDVKIKTEKLTIVKKDGKKVEKLVPATKFQPGDTLVYTINYTNNTAETVIDATINDPIPQDTVYILDSAKGDGANITFSIDGGKTFKKPSLLVYEVKTPNGAIEKRTASPEEYTNIRWVISKIEAGGKGMVSFHVRLKR